MSKKWELTYQKKDGTQATITNENCFKAAGKWCAEHAGTLLIGTGALILGIASANTKKKREVVKNQTINYDGDLLVVATDDIDKFKTMLAEDSQATVVAEVGRF